MEQRNGGVGDKEQGEGEGEGEVEGEEEGGSRYVQGMLQAEEKAEGEKIEISNGNT